MATVPTAARSSADASTVATGVPAGESRLPVPAPRLADEIARRLVHLHPVVAAGAIAVAGFVVLLLLALLAGLLVRDVLGDGVLGTFDVDVSEWLADGRTSGWNTVAYIGSELAGIWEVPVGTSVAVGALCALRRFAWAGFLATGVLLEGALYVSITYLFVRERPAVLRLEELIHDDSFPSGHTAAAVVLYGGIALIVTAATRNRGWRALAWGAAIMLPPFVALARMYRGMHFFSDAVVGYLIGLGCVAVALFAVAVGVRVARRRGVGDEASP